MRKKSALCVSERPMRLMSRAAKRLFKCQKRKERATVSESCLVRVHSRAQDWGFLLVVGTHISVTITADSYQTPAEEEAHSSLFSLHAAT